MANQRSSNSWFVDTSSTTDANTYIGDSNLKLVGFIYTVANTTDVIDVYNKANGSAAQGSLKLRIKAATAGETKQVRLEECPIVFPNGIWVTLTGSPTATLIFQNVGSGS